MNLNQLLEATFASIQTTRSGHNVSYVHADPVARGKRSPSCRLDYHIVDDHSKVNPNYYPHYSAYPWSVSD